MPGLYTGPAKIPTDRERMQHRRRMARRARRAARRSA